MNNPIEKLKKKGKKKNSKRNRKRKNLQLNLDQKHALPVVEQEDLVHLVSLLQ